MEAPERRGLDWADESAGGAGSTEDLAKVSKSTVVSEAKAVEHGPHMSPQLRMYLQWERQHQNADPPERAELRDLFVRARADGLSAAEFRAGLRAKFGDAISPQMLSQLFLSRSKVFPIAAKAEKAAAALAHKKAAREIARARREAADGGQPGIPPRARSAPTTPRTSQVDPHYRTGSAGSQSDDMSADCRMD